MSLLKSSATVGSMTLASRVLGFVRDILIARFLGIGPVADAFFYAFTFPNLFRRFFGEGAFNSAFVPLFAKRLEGEGERSARLFAGQALSVLLLCLTLVTLVAELAMPMLVFVIAPGFADTPEKFDLTVLFTRIAFPYLLFVSLVALLSGILNSTGKFAIAAAAPILLNVVLIAGLIFATDYFQTTGHLLVYGVALSGILQFLVLAWACRRIGLLPRLPRPRLTPPVRRLIALGIPGAIAGGITQINLMIGGIIASLEDGARAILYYADRLYQLPLGVIGVAMGVVLLPELSRRLRAGDERGVHASQNRSLELSMVFTLPAAAALAAMPAFLVTVLFQRGAFDAIATTGTAQALTAFAFGLPAFVAIKVFSPGFFAREDTKTPMQFAAISVAVNIIGSLSLFWWIGFLGIAIATTLAGWTNAVLLARRLYKLGHFRLDARAKRALPRLTLAAILMGLAVAYGAQAAAPLLTLSLGVKVSALAALVFAGALLYGVLVLILGAVRLTDLKALIRPTPSA
jgi:putative peptidoglycan lipid II flippase